MRELDKISLNLEIARNIKNKIFGQDNIQILFVMKILFLLRKMKKKEMKKRSMKKIMRKRKVKKRKLKNRKRKFE